MHGGRLSWTDQYDNGGTVRRLSYQHDAAGNRTRITHPDGPWFGTLHNSAGRPVRIAENSDGTGASGTFLATFYYNPDGTPESTLRGMTSPTSDYAYTTYGHDALARLTGLTDQFSDSATSNVWHSFAYNPASGIATATRDNNAYAWQGHYAVSRTYNTNGLNQYSGTSSAQGGATFTYDQNGNLRTTPGPIQGQTVTYTYDVENRLVGSSTGGTLRYDPLGRLWQTSAPGHETIRYLYDGDALVGEYDASNGAQLARYVHGPAAGADDPMIWYGGSSVSQANRRYLIPNHQGSITAVADGNGAVIAINRYDEYGIPASTNQGRFEYTGQIWLPELGLYHYKSRAYSPTLGRMLQTDSIGYEGGINLYAYVGNDPINHVDPDGELPACYRCPTGPLIEILTDLAIGDIQTAYRDPSLTNILIAGATTIGAPVRAVSATIRAGRAIGRAVRPARAAQQPRFSGRAQRTRSQGEPTGHAFRSAREAQAMRASGNYERVRLNQTFNTTTGGGVNSNLRPDVAGLRPDGKVDIVEVLSPGQTERTQRALYGDALGDRLGDFRVVTPTRSR